MDIVTTARTASWNELILATLTSGSFGERVKNNFDAAISSRANGAAYTDGRAINLDNVDALVSSRAVPGTAMDLWLALKLPSGRRRYRLPQHPAPTVSG